MTRRRVLWPLLRLLGAIVWGVLIIWAVLAVQPRAAASSRFTGKFELVPLFDSGHRPVVVNGHTYYGERNRIGFRTDAGDVVTVFAGATTDGASIPRPVWPLLPPDGPYYEAAAFHDACYKSKGSWLGRHGERPGHVWPADYSRAQCDETLRQAMAALGVPWWPRVPIFLAVRWFGSAGWGT